MERNNVVLVDAFDNPIKEMEKLEAHRLGLLHRAFSVFILNDEGEMLIHQRASSKYHGANLWTNACCSHPKWNEDVKHSAAQRLQYEMGMVCDLEKAFSFTYKAAVENGLIEHEYDHVFVGYSNAKPQPNAQEVAQYKWILPEALQQMIANKPELFTFWFKKSLEEVLLHLEQKAA